MCTASKQSYSALAASPSLLQLVLRLQRVDNYEYELPSDFDDEEIDEEAAFTAEDEKQFADWFGNGASAGLLRLQPH